MSKNSCKAAESIEDAVLRMAPGNCANSAGNWLLMREKQSIHL